MVIFKDRNRTTMRLIVCALCAVCVALYASPLLDRTKEWEFFHFWDDEINFTMNAMVHRLTWTNLYAMFTTQKIHVYEPLGFLLKAIQFEFGGGAFDPWKIRCVTLVLHLGACAVLMQCTLLLHDILRLVRPATEPTVVSNSHPRRIVDGCFLATTLYAIHPVTTEVVAWPSAQPYALAALFSTGSLYFYFQNVRNCLQQEAQEHGITRKVYQARLYMLGVYCWTHGGRLCR